MKATYFLGMEPRWVAHAFSVWYASGLGVPFRIERSNKSEHLVIIIVTIDEKNYDEIGMVNQMWKATGCKIYKKQMK